MGAVIQETLMAGGPQEGERGRYVPASRTYARSASSGILAALRPAHGRAPGPGGQAPFELRRGAAAAAPARRPERCDARPADLERGPGIRARRVGAARGDGGRPARAGRAG